MKFKLQLNICGAFDYIVERIGTLIGHMSVLSIPLDILVEVVYP